ncbi:MAG: histidinol dehydrogenase [Actinomycetaceae bacterium]|nr:histidinol dehydrogenase [Actinomycetaceae bacterium]
MMNLLDLRATDIDATTLARLLPRASLDVEGALETVRPIFADLRTRGFEALLDLSERFDGVRPTHIRVAQKDIDAAVAALDPQVRASLELCIEHNRKGHEAQLPAQVSTTIIPGGTVHQRYIPVRRVGLYAPGGLAVYPSSVVMNVVAAQVAGVQSIALASPPQKDFAGLPHPTILAACGLLGVNEVYAMGGAQAIAALGHGLQATGEHSGQESIDAVDVVTGPGNIYVAAAKRALAGVCGIDAEAGTTEIAIVADRSANPEWVAADLISQAEHDPAAASVLITDSPELVQAVEDALEPQISATLHSERIRTALSGPQSGIVLVSSIKDGLEVANIYGAEHLEIHTANAYEDALKVHNAGAIFIGGYSPVPLGDYLAGSNHVLPTGGTARFASGLSVYAFLKPVQMVEYSKEALAEMSGPLTALAEAEALPAHGVAARIRQG